MASSELYNLSALLYPEIVTSIETNNELLAKAMKSKKRKKDTPQWELPTNNKRFDDECKEFVMNPEHLQIATRYCTDFSNLYRLECCERILLAYCVSVAMINNIVESGTYESLFKVASNNDMYSRISKITYGQKIRKPLAKSTLYLTPRLCQILADNRVVKEMMFGKAPSAFYTNYPVDLKLLDCSYDPKSMIF